MRDTRATGKKEKRNERRARYWRREEEGIGRNNKFSGTIGITAITPLGFRETRHENIPDRPSLKNSASIIYVCIYIYRSFVDEIIFERITTRTVRFEILSSLSPRAKIISQRDNGERWIIPNECISVTIVEQRRTAGYSGSGDITSWPFPS